MLCCTMLCIRELCGQYRIFVEQRCTNLVLIIVTKLGKYYFKYITQYIKGPTCRDFYISVQLTEGATTNV